MQDSPPPAAATEGSLADRVAQLLLDAAAAAREHATPTPAPTPLPAAAGPRSTRVSAQDIHCEQDDDPTPAPVGPPQGSTTSATSSGSHKTAVPEDLVAAVLARLGHADDARRKYVLRDLATAPPEDVQACGDHAAHRCHHRHAHRHAHTHTHHGQTASSGSESESDGESDSSSGSDSDSGERKRRNRRTRGNRRGPGAVVPPELFREGVDERGRVPDEVKPTNEDTALYAEDRARLDWLDRLLAWFVAVSVGGMLFVFLHAATGAMAWGYAAWLRARGRHYLGARPALWRASVALAALAAAACLGTWVAALVLVLVGGLAPTLRAWGRVLAPLAAPLVAAHVALGAVCIRRVRAAVKDEAWAALLAAAAQTQSGVQHYRITRRRRRVVPCAPEHAAITVLVNPLPRLRARLVAATGIGDAILEDSLDPLQEARIEFRRGHMSAVIRIPEHCHSSGSGGDEDNEKERQQQEAVEVEMEEEADGTQDRHLSASASEEREFRVGTGGLFLFRNRLFVTLADARPLFEARAFRHVESLEDVVVRLLRGLTRDFEGSLKAIHAVCRTLEGTVGGATQEHHLRRNYELQKALVYHVNALQSNAHVLQRIAERLPLAPRTADALYDVVAENAQCQKMADLILAVTTTLMASRSSVIEANLNSMMKNMNSLAIAISIPTLLSGIGGMSEYTELTGGATHRALSTALFCVASVALVVLVFYTLRWAEPLWSRPALRRRKKL